MSSEETPVAEETFTTEQLNGKVNGLMGHISGKNQDEVSEIINKQPEAVQEAYKDRILSQYGIKPVEQSNEGVFIKNQTPVIKDPDPVVTEPVALDDEGGDTEVKPNAKDPKDNPEKDLDEDALYQGFMDRFNKDAQAESVKESQKKAEELLAESFGDNVTDFLGSKEGKYLLNYVNGAVQGGTTYFDATNEALDFLDNNHKEPTPDYLSRKESPVVNFGESPADKINKELYEAQINALRGNR